MTINERYRAASIHRTKKYNKMYILIALFFVLSFTISHYTNIYEAGFEANIASWKMKINNEEISENATLTNKIELVNYAGSDVILPGQSGYFTIEVDPTGTEVSILYEITLDFSNMPSDIEITGYSLNSENGQNIQVFPSDNKFSSQLLINGNSRLETTDKQTYIVYWQWPGETINTEENEYYVSAQVKVQQIV